MKIFEMKRFKKDSYSAELAQRKAALRRELFESFQSFSFEQTSSQQRHL
jgi:hypothetical protein